MNKYLWRNKTDRLQAVQYGIANETLRKPISKDNSGANSGDAQNVCDGLMFSIHGTLQKIRLKKILENHGLYAPFKMHNNFQYILNIPSAACIMVAQCRISVGTYTLENLKLEYETIQIQDIASDVSQVAVCPKSSLKAANSVCPKSSNSDEDCTVGQVNGAGQCKY